MLQIQALLSFQVATELAQHMSWRMRTAYLCMFSASSTVSGKAFPVVSGSSSTSPPAIKPTTAGSQTHARHIRNGGLQAL